MFNLSKDKQKIKLTWTITRAYIKRKINEFKSICGDVYESDEAQVPETLKEFLNWDLSMETTNGGTFNDLMEYITDELNAEENKNNDYFDVSETVEAVILNWLCDEFKTDEICNALYLHYCRKQLAKC